MRLYHAFLCNFWHIVTFILHKSYDLQIQYFGKWENWEKNNYCSEENPELYLAHLKCAHRILALPQLTTWLHLGTFSKPQSWLKLLPNNHVGWMARSWVIPAQLLLLPQSALLVPPVCWGLRLDKPVDAVYKASRRRRAGDTGKGHIIYWLHSP